MPFFNYCSFLIFSIAFQVFFGSPGVSVIVITIIIIIIIIIIIVILIIIIIIQELQIRREIYASVNRSCS